MEASTAEVIGAFGSVVSGFGALATFGVAVYAAQTWRKGLVNTNGDACVQAAHDLHGEFWRCLEILDANDKARVWPAHELVWQKHREFSKRWAVARRYLDDARVPDMPHKSMLAAKYLTLNCKAIAEGGDTGPDYMDHRQMMQGMLATFTGQVESAMKPL